MTDFIIWAIYEDNWVARLFVLVSIVLLLSVLVTFIVMAFIAFTATTLSVLGIFYFVTLFILIMQYRKEE